MGISSMRLRLHIVQAGILQHLDWHARAAVRLTDHRKLRA